MDSKCMKFVLFEFQNHCDKYLLLQKLPNLQPINIHKIHTTRKLRHIYLHFFILTVFAENHLPQKVCNGDLGDGGR